MRINAFPVAVMAALASGCVWTSERGGGPPPHALLSATVCAVEDEWRPSYLPPEVTRVFGTTRFRQDSPVRGLAFNAEGTLLASGEAGGHSVRVWERSTGREIARLDCNREGSLYAAPTFRESDGSLVVIGQWGFGVWDSGTWRRTLFTAISNSHLSSCSPDGQLVIDAGYRAIRTWDTSTGKKLQEIAVLPDEVIYGNYRAYAVSPAAPILAYGEHATVKLANARTGEAVREFACPARRVTALAFSPDGSLLAAGGVDGTVRVYDVTNGQRLSIDGRDAMNRADEQTCLGKNRRITSLAFLRGSEVLVSGNAWKQVRFWDVREMRRHRQAGRNGQISGASGVHAIVPVRGGVVVWEHGYGTLLVPESDFTVTLLRPDRMSPYHTAIATTRTGDAIALGDRLGRIEIRSAEDGRITSPADSGIWWREDTLSISPDGRVWASGFNTVTVRDVTRPPGEQELLKLEGCRGAPIVLRDGRRVLVRRGRPKLQFEVWDALSREKLVSFFPEESGFSTWYMAMRDLLVWSEYDGKTRWLAVYDLRTGKSVRRIDLNSESLKAAAASGDESRLVYGASHKTYSVDLGTGQSLVIPDGAVLERFGLADVSPDGALACVPYLGHGFRVYDLHTGDVACERRFGAMEAVRFSPSGRWLLVQNDTDDLGVWDTVSWEQTASVNTGTRIRRITVVGEAPERLTVLSQNRGGTCYVIELGTTSAFRASGVRPRAAQPSEPRPPRPPD